ncbi:ATP-dependent endonuclease [Kitasatospora saccharophila]|uniref:ATP-dependent nuclease n=1 Tax=Kitasatospora saccharophila TaxID=407973 RepID=UPI00362C963C
MTSRWRGMPDRPQRPLYFLDISRTQPINTQIGYGKAATRANFTGQITPFGDDDRKLLGRVLNKPIKAGGMAVYQNKQVGVLDTGNGTYSNFHQGAGEDATADLVDLLRLAPRNSLIIIDEVESSLHPRAQRRLMVELFDIARTRGIQFILSTHSQVILEQLPTEARVYIQAQHGGGRSVLYGVSSDFAMSLMDDVHHPDLVLFCEDAKAGTLIDALIRNEDADLIRRVQILAAGPASTVSTLGDLSFKKRFPVRAIGILDADQKPADGCICLPGSKAPEKELFESFSDPNWEKVAERLEIRVGDLLQAAENAQQVGNHHAWVQRTAEQLGPRMRTDHLWDAMAAVWARESVDPASRAEFVAAIRNSLTD